MRLATLLIIGSLLSACSVYTSKGREFLEQGGLKFALDTGQISTYGCSTEEPKEIWTPFEERDGNQLFTRDSEGYELLIATAHGLFCDFNFSSAREMYNNTSRALEACLHQSPASCQSKFDFQ